MPLGIGIVGLPNVGKSTLFNALTHSQLAASANYPFCTIDPNIGIVEVPDERLNRLAEMVHPEKIIPAAVEFHDIAGLVKGASKGEGLGNQFLANIRECDAIVEVVRFFEDPNVVHVHGKVNPKDDREVIETELIIADLQTLEKRLEKAESTAKSGEKEAIVYAELLKKMQKHLAEGKIAISCPLTEEEKIAMKDLHLLTMKPFLYVLNVDEGKVKGLNIEKIKNDHQFPKDAKVILISAKIEAELVGFSGKELCEYLDSIGIKETGLQSLVRLSYDALDLITYFTAGPKEVHAWTVKKGTHAPQAAGVIHTDFEKGFIRAEVISYEDFVKYGGEQGAREHGSLRLEGKDYIVQDGDIMHFRFHV